MSRWYILLAWRQTFQHMPLDAQSNVPFSSFQDLEFGSLILSGTYFILYITSSHICTSVVQASSPGPNSAVMLASRKGCASDVRQHRQGRWFSSGNMMSASTSCRRLRPGFYYQWTQTSKTMICTRFSKAIVIWFRLQRYANQGKQWVGIAGPW
ncbi:uncharacterized protein EDB91DRAFT_1087967 [Suillus paluster]|uniref:uncharacterized protein n=1 Tax=Suillus paluster TaxID=48578 RepID=UPI001B8603DA|nr:uncharacterized protein EDB91DRAFT_1087967 [Suillus paluster]KAG1722927.1 hypothetical protein EDB91DRAFT_1087967 [Suillus paluster]